MPRKNTRTPKQKYWSRRNHLKMYLIGVGTTVANSNRDRLLTLKEAFIADELFISIQKLIKQWDESNATITELKIDEKYG